MPISPNTALLKQANLEISYYGHPEKEKTPLLFIHGSGGSGLLWTRQLRGLAEEFSPIAVDLPGHGNSGGNPVSQVSLYRDYIKEFTEILGLPLFVIAGHSLGGAIALSYALQYPDDLQGIVLASTGARLRVSPKFLHIYGQGKKVTGLFKYLYGPEAAQELIEKGKEVIASVPPEVFYADFIACDKFDAMEHLEKINLPALIVCGDHDQMTPLKYSRFLAEKIPKAKLQIMPGLGHMPMLENSKEFNKILLSFMRNIINS